MDEMEIPEYFICPISLQIMKDPVTTVTGITFDRQSIEQWLSTASSTSDHLCPVTKLPLSSDLTPNHILRRLIQAWCISTGIDRIPTPKLPLQASLLLNLTRHVTRHGADALNAVLKLDELATENEKNHRPMAEAGVPRAMLLFILRCFKNNTEILGLEEALRTLHLLWTSTTSSSINGHVEDNMELVQSLLWILKMENVTVMIKSHAITVLKNVIQVSSSSFMEKLNPNFFEEMMKILRNNTSSPQAVKSVLPILIQTCNSGRNRYTIIECGAVFELIELELNRKPDKKTTELVFSLLANMCSCADGRQQVLKHAGGIAVVAKRLLRNTPATDEWALRIMELIARFSATRDVVMEMLRVGAVTKLCMVLQADSEDYLKKKAREILRLHSNAWSNSSCIQVYLLTRNPR